MRNPYRDFSNVNPQRENGHRQIENTVYQALMRAGFSGAEYQIIFCVIDKTWGWDKKEDMIPMVQFETSTGLERRYISRILHDLKEAHVIVVQSTPQGGRGHGNVYMLNKYWDTWVNLKTGERLLPSQPLETTPTGQPLGLKVAAESTFSETPPPSQPLASKVAPLSTIGKVASPSTFNEGKVDKNEGKVDSHAQGKVASPSTSKERYKEKDQKKDIPIKKEKKAYLGNVYLTEEEYNKLVERFGPEGAKDRIEGLSLYIKSKGAERKYKDHYATILNWERMKKSSAEEKGKGASYGRGETGAEGRGTGTHRENTPKGDRFGGFKPIKSGSAEPDDGDEN